MTAVGAFATGAVITADDQNAGGGAAWASWTPTYTNLTVGNGTVISKYTHVGRKVVWKYQITFGTTSVMGTAPTLTLPVAASDNVEAGSCPVRILDSGTNTFVGCLVPSSTTGVIVQLVSTGNAATNYLVKSSITSSLPMTWATGDQFAFTLEYEAASDGP